ncbi:MAG: thioredoxin family protein [Saonia sp.]
MKYFALVISFFFSFGLFAQDWKKTYAEALTHAKGEDKPIILVFSGSDWCAPCKKLERNIWQSEEFKSYAIANYVLYNADFPRKKANKLPVEKAVVNKQLAAVYNPKGHFPLVVVLDRQEKILGKASYEKVSPTKYIALLNSFIK